MHTCSDRLHDIVSEIPPSIDVLVATKYATATDMVAFNNQDHPIIFGENRLQDGRKRQAAIPNTTIPWHFIGHVQRNKLKKILTHYQCIQSVDRLSLIHAIQTQSFNQNTITPILLQLNPLNDPKKHGFNLTSIHTAAEECERQPNITLTGVMCMAPLSTSSKEIEKTFRMTRKTYDTIKRMGNSIDTLSMGMSNDYKIAINEGSTMIRLGRILFT